MGTHRSRRSPEGGAELSAGRAAVPRRILYGRRRGRALSPNRRLLIDELLPRLAVPEGCGPLDAARLFAGAPVFDGNDAPAAPPTLWLEVGFGAGEHLVAQAAAHPGIGFIGCEPFINGVGGALARINAARLENVRLFADDARLVIDRLADGALGRVFVLFPDPWPKRRHTGRRFIGADTLAALARVMAPGAELRVASDDARMIRWTLAQTLKTKEFQWLAEGPAAWRTRPADQPATRYEKKARERGAKPAFLAFRRRAGGENAAQKA